MIGQGKYRSVDTRNSTQIPKSPELSINPIGRTIGNKDEPTGVLKSSNHGLSNPSSDHRVETDSIIGKPKSDNPNSLVNSKKVSPELPPTPSTTLM